MTDLDRQQLKTASTGLLSVFAYWYYWLVGNTAKADECAVIAHEMNDAWNELEKSRK